MPDKHDNDVVNVKLAPEDALRLLLETDLREQENSEDDKPAEPIIKARPE